MHEHRPELLKSYSIKPYLNNTWIYKVYLDFLKVLYKINMLTFSQQKKLFYTFGIFGFWKKMTLRKQTKSLFFLWFAEKERLFGLLSFKVKSSINEMTLILTWFSALEWPKTFQLEFDFYFFHLRKKYRNGKVCLWWC